MICLCFIEVFLFFFNRFEFCDLEKWLEVLFFYLDVGLFLLFDMRFIFLFVIFMRKISESNEGSG